MKQLVISIMNNNLFYTCSLIEYIGREKKQRRGDVVAALGSNALHRIYKYSDVLHSDPIEHVADQYAGLSRIEEGTFDNVGACQYTVPTYCDIGKVFCRLVEDVSDEDHLKGIEKAYKSWLSDAISNYNSDLFYQPRDYLKECYLAGEVL